MTTKKSILYKSRGCKVHMNEQGEPHASTTESCQKLAVFNWLSNLPPDAPYDLYEVRFKNTRKGYFRNENNITLKVGDIVAVEASPGHDTGIISLTGPLVELQMKRHGAVSPRYEIRKIYRKAKPVDIEKWQDAVALEHGTMIRTRQIVQRLGLNMKIGDVEYQGDKTKAIFYYIADERIDFRELIKVLAEEFRIRVEMRQIGARQEAGLIGGIGSCGRELCCAQWMCNFVSVTTSAARYQDISLNPQKLAGQCSKLKCCLNYELDTYLDAMKSIPRINAPFDTVNGLAYLMKTDVLKRLMWFSFDKDSAVNVTVVPVERVQELIKLSKKNIKIESLLPANAQPAKAAPDFKSAVGEDSITRFDEKRKKKKRKPKNGEKGANGGAKNDGSGNGGKEFKENSPAKKQQTPQQPNTDAKKSGSPHGRRHHSGKRRENREKENEGTAK